MFALIRYFIKFIAATAFKEGELNKDKPTFDPAKLAGVILLVSYILIISVITYKMVNLHHRVEIVCPDLVHILAENPREDLVGRYDISEDGKTLTIRCGESAY